MDSNKGPREKDFTMGPEAGNRRKRAVGVKTGTVWDAGLESSKRVLFCNATLLFCCIQVPFDLQERLIASRRAGGAGPTARPSPTRQNGMRTGALLLPNAALSAVTTVVDRIQVVGQFACGRGFTPRLVGE
jgi:hypothetical protein